MMVSVVMVFCLCDYEKIFEKCAATRHVHGRGFSLEFEILQIAFFKFKAKPAMVL
jgi:hypothetical protein